MAISLLHLDESGKCVEANARVPFEGVTFYGGKRLNILTGVRPPIYSV
jgi:hypothetical protein